MESEESVTTKNYDEVSEDNLDLAVKLIDWIFAAKANTKQYPS